MGFSDAIAEEARRFGEIENDYVRAEFWAALPVFRNEIIRRFDMVASIRRHLAGRDHLVALTIACGDMSGEYNLLKRVGVSEIDAFDISEGQRDKFYRDVYDGQITVNYEIADVNQLSLEPRRYDVVYVQHAYHHIEQLEHVADQIRAGLNTGGVLAIVDYIGANYLQRSPRQRDLCGAIWRAMPEKYRISRAGRVVRELRIPPKDSLPPYEAVRAEEILPVLQARFDAEETFFYGGILMPLFNGFASNFTDSPEDQRFLRVMWEYDRWLLDNGEVAPDYMKAIFVPRPDPLPDPAPTETVQRNGRTNPALSASPPLSAELSAPTGDWSPEKRVGVLGSAKRHLGYRFGHRFASVSHTDRTTGRPRRSLVPVVNYDSFRREVLVISTSGKRAAWFRDVRKDPNVEVAIGGIRFPAKATRLGPTEANEALKAFERRGAFARSARRRLSALVGQPYDGSALDRERLAREVRIVAFRIDDRPRGSGPVRPTARSQAVEPTPKPISGTREFGSTP